MVKGFERGLIFVVEKKEDVAADVYGLFIGGATTAVTNAGLYLGYRSPAYAAISQAHYANGLNYYPPMGFTKTPTIHSFWFSTSGGKKYWNNGGVTPEASEPTQTAALISFDRLRIANSFPFHYYKGDIAEIIMFNRALSEKDRQSVESYLSKKWSIRIS